MEVTDSARRHGYTTEQITSAVDHAVGSIGAVGGEGHEGVMYLGLVGESLIEVLVLDLDDDRHVAVHAMKATGYWIRKILG